MSIAQVGAAQGASAAGGSNAITPGGFDTTGATLLIVTAGNYNVTDAGTLIDSNGNTWHSLTVQSIGGSLDTVIWYSYDKSGSALVVGVNHTVTYHDSYPAIVFTAWSGTLGAHADPFDGQQNGATGSSITTLATGSVTPVVAGSLVVASLCVDVGGATPYTLDNGFTVNSVAYSAGNNMGSAQGWKIQTGAVNPTWTTAAAGHLAAAIACFKPAVVSSINPDSIVSAGLRVGVTIRDITVGS